MSVVSTSGAGQKIKRTVGNPTISACTLMAWCNWQGNGYSGAISIGADDGANFYSLGMNTLQPALFTPTSGVLSSSRSMPLNTWHHQTLQVIGTGASQVLAYFDGVLDQTGAASATPTNAAVYISDDTGADPSSVSVGEFKMWDGILTQAEIWREMRCRAPQRLRGLLSYMPLRDKGWVAIDQGPLKGNLWTPSGTYVSGPHDMRVIPALQRTRFT